MHDLVLTGNRQLPNRSASCVQLLLDQAVVAESCYEVESDKKVESTTTHSSPTLSSPSLSGSLSFVHILPNPAGADRDHEEVALIWKPFS